jgi:hypothetical protein
MNVAIYWVGSDGEKPEQIHFSEDVAFSHEHNFIDSFDVKGMLVESYKRTEQEDYTTDF